MTTFAGRMDFTGPQPFNVSIEAEDVPHAAVAMPVLGPAVPVVAQEVTPDRDLYPRQRYGVRRGIVR